MSVHAFIGNALQKNSRYYLDPTQKNGECKTVQPCDPEKLKQYRELKSQRHHYRSLNFYGRKNRKQIDISKEIKNYEMNNINGTFKKVHP